MKINVNDREKLQKALDEVQGKAKTRTLDYENIIDAVERFEMQLEKLLPKKYWQGIGCIHDRHAQNFPNAYKGEPLSTKVWFVRGASGWFVTAITRTRTSSAGHQYTMLRLSDEQSKAIVDYVTHSFQLGGNR